VLSRVDLVLLAVPLLVAAAWAREGRPPSGATSTVTASASARADATSARPAWDFTASVVAPRGAGAVQLRFGMLGGEPIDLITTPETAQDLSGGVPIMHSGRQVVLSLEHRVIGENAWWVGVPSGPTTVERVQRPTVVPVQSLVLPRRLQGLTGAHDSARPGDGGDFRDVHLFAPGDRLRRIDWKATARRAQVVSDLYVRRTAATADATVVIVVDSSSDVGQNVADWSRADPWEQGTSSLDLTRQAAASLAVAYSRAGDRVGYQDLSLTTRLVPPGGGARHLDRVLRTVALVQPSGVRPSRRRAPVLVPGALVYLLSTFLDEDAAHLADLWRAAGHRIVAVDVLPPAETRGLDARGRIAHRIVMLEREDRLAEMVASGVELLRWSEDRAGDRAATMRALSRPLRRGR
jgi:hypothetical protein